MLDIMVAIAVAILAIVLIAAVLYIGGFLLSVAAGLFASIADALTHHHHRGDTLPG